MSLFSDNFEAITGTAQERTTGTEMPEDYNSPADSRELKVVFILLYCTVFVLCFAGL